MERPFSLAARGSSSRRPAPTLTLATGLSLGPEIPLIVLAGMEGTSIGKRFRQSVLSCRVLNLAAASAAIAGFFGFPLAGAIFVLELPHSMSLQFFETLSSATLASIVAVVFNRLCSGAGMEGTFKYPYLNASFPSHIFVLAIIFEIFGAAVGTMYYTAVLFGKQVCHFHLRKLLTCSLGLEPKRATTNYGAIYDSYDLKQQRNRQLVLNTIDGNWYAKSKLYVHTDRQHFERRG